MHWGHFILYHLWSNALCILRTQPELKLEIHSFSNGVYLLLLSQAEDCITSYREVLNLTIYLPLKYSNQKIRGLNCI